MTTAPCSCNESLALRSQVEDAALLIAALLAGPAQYTLNQAALWLARWSGNDCAVCREPTADGDRLPFGAAVAHAACAMTRTLAEG